MTDQEYMKLAIQLALATQGQTNPNPVVGAVVVKDNAIVGMGAHLKAGEGHAEVHAIRMAGEKAEGATVYVTLEPCSHFGKTPPCCNLLIDAKVKRVVVAMADPNPLVSGRGIERLRQAGVEVEVGILQQDAIDLNKVFFHYIATKTPFVTLKSAISLDGKIATVTGESKWITGEEAREDVHRYRHMHDAILVGVNTVLADNPSLTCRLPEGGKNPIRVILDTNLRIPLDAEVVTDQLAQTWIITGNKVDADKKKRLQSKRVEVIQMDTERIEIQSLLSLLGEKEVASLFVEGGAKVNGSFIKAKAIQQLVTYMAPKIIGGEQSPTFVGGEGFAKMNDVLQLDIQSVEKIGEDIKLISIPK